MANVAHACGRTSKKRDGGPATMPERQPTEPCGNAKLYQGRYGNYKGPRKAVKQSDRYSTDPIGQVIILSKQKFTRTEYKLLGYNLNFIQTPNSINKKDLTHDIKQFSRRIKLRDHFGLTTPEKQAFKLTSIWEPSENHHTVKTFLDDFSRKVDHGLKNWVTAPAKREE